MLDCMVCDMWCVYWTWIEYGFYIGIGVGIEGGRKKRRRKWSLN